MINQQEKLQKIFKKEQKIERKKVKLDEKLEKIFNQKCTIAFDLYSEFLKNNQTFNSNLEYFKLYIESGYFLVEELIFEKQYENLVEFKHKSNFRQNHRVNLFLDTQEQDYTNNSTVIDKNQFDRLLINFTIKIRA